MCRVQCGASETARYAVGANGLNEAAVGGAFGSS